MTAQKSLYYPTIVLVGCTLLTLGCFVLSAKVVLAEEVSVVAVSESVESVVDVVEQAPVAVVETVDEGKANVEVASPVANTATVVVAAGGSVSAPVLNQVEVVSDEVGSVPVPVAGIGQEVVSSEIVAATSSGSGGGGGGSPQPTPMIAISPEVTAATAIVSTGDVVISPEVSATTYSSTIPPPGSETVSNEVTATTLPAGPEVVSDEVNARTNDADQPPGGCTTNCGGGGGCIGDCGGGPTSTSGGGGYIIPPEVEEDFPGTCSEYLLEYIRLGWDNNPLEVIKLQVFLNQFEGFNLPVTGVYSLADFNAVSIFQARYGRDILGPWGIADSTGFVFITTRMAINNIVCRLSTENNLDLRNYYLQEAARLGYPVSNTPSPVFIPDNTGIASTTPATWFGRLQAAMVGLLSYFHNHGGWRVVGFLLILLALFILIWRLSRNVLDDDFDNDGGDIGGNSPLLLPPVFFDESKEDEKEFATAGDEIEEVVIPSEEEELNGVIGEEAPAGNEPLSEYGQRPLDNLR